MTEQREARRCARERTGKGQVGMVEPTIRNISPACGRTAKADTPPGKELLKWDHIIRAIIVPRCAGGHNSGLTSQLSFQMKYCCPAKGTGAAFAGL